MSLLQASSDPALAFAEPVLAQADQRTQVKLVSPLAPSSSSDPEASDTQGGNPLPWVPPLQLKLLPLWILKNKATSTFRGPGATGRTFLKSFPSFVSFMTLLNKRPLLCVVLVQSRNITLIFLLRESMWQEGYVYKLMSWVMWNLILLLLLAACGNLGHSISVSSSAKKYINVYHPAML